MISLRWHRSRIQWRRPRHGRVVFGRFVPLKTAMPPMSEVEIEAFLMEETPSWERSANK